MSTTPRDASSFGRLKAQFPTQDIYQNIVESAQDGIWIIDEKGETAFANLRMAEILGYAAEEMLGAHFTKFVDKSQQELAIQQFERCRTEERFFKFPLRKKDGSRAWTTFATNPLYGENDSRVGAMAIVTDQTERLQNETLLIAQRDIFDLLNAGGNVHQALTILIKAIETILEGVIGSVLLLDDEGKHVLTGAAPSLPAGYSESIHGQPIGPMAGSCGTAAYTGDLVIVEDIQTDPKWALYKDIAKQYGLSACWSNPITDHTGRVMGTFAMYFNEARRPTEAEIAFVLDATSAAALVIEHVRMKETFGQVAQKQKQIADREHGLQIETLKSLRQREEFILLASHELRTPLTPLTLQLELARTILSEDDQLGTKINDLRKLVTGAEKQVATLAKLSEDLLSVAWISSDHLPLKLETQSLNNIVLRAVEKMSADMAEANCAKVVTMNAQIEGRWDGWQLERAFCHILHNAIKFGVGRPVEVDVNVDGPNAVVKIKDHGIGIAKEDQGKLFQRYEKIVSMRHYGGLGIGLFIAMEIVKAHGGTIDVESEFGKGACFSVVLPTKRLQ
jgi:PAS domain S-box-containing protein